MKNKIVGTVLILVLLLSLGLVTSAPAMASTSTIDVSRNIFLTENSEYDRNPSIIYDGANYWLFYTKGDDTVGVRGSYDPDSDKYVVYYKTAGSIADLEAATETKLGLSESSRPTDFDQRVVSATYFNGKVYAFVSSGQSGTDRGMYYYEYSDSIWDGPTTLIADTTARGGHVNVTSDINRIYIVWESSDGSSDCYTWDGTLSPKIDISNDNMPKITLVGTTIYVVSIEDVTGDIEVYDAGTSANPSFSSPSTAVAGAGLYDPCIFSDGTYLYVVTAPYIGPEDRQYMIQTRYSGISWSEAKIVSYGGYGSIAWWDYWPCGFHDGSDAYLFFTTETNPADHSFSDAEIAMVKMDWDLDHDHYFTIRNAVEQATSTTINIAAGIYYEGPQIVINQNLSIVGEDRTTTIIRPLADTGSSGDARGWFLVDTGYEFNLNDLTLDGTGHLIYQAIRHRGWGTIDSVDFKEIKYNESGPHYAGLAVVAYGTGPVDISNCTFTEIGRVGVLYYALGGSSVFSNNEYIGKGDGDFLDYALDISAGAQVEVFGNSISNCRGVASSDGSTSAGIMVTTYYGPGTGAVILCNTLINNTSGIAVGYDNTDDSSVDAHYNDFIENVDYGVESTNPIVHAEYNWWGDRSGPYHPTSWTYDSSTITNPDGKGDEVTDWVLYDPWIGQGGFVTGGGWIESPVGAYTLEPSLSGKANFGFACRYKKGAAEPTGETEFIFRTADLNFYSISYDWLVVAGNNARFKGWGTINGIGSYRFMLWAGDDDTDTFRIKIWEEDENSEVIVYDNGMNQDIGGGSIVIHKK